MAHPDISLADYLAAERAALGEKHEYFNGVVRPRDPQPMDHAAITFTLTSLLVAAVDESQHGVFATDVRVQLSPTCIVYPDVCVSLDKRMSGTDDPLLSPLLVIEVFTPETVAFDLGRKAHQYRACPTMAEYVLVDCERPFVHVQRRAADGTHWEMREYRDADAVELRCLGITFPLAAIYREVGA